MQAMRPKNWRWILVKLLSLLRVFPYVAGRTEPGTVPAFLCGTATAQCKELESIPHVTTCQGQGKHTGKNSKWEPSTAAAILQILDQHKQRCMSLKQNTIVVRLVVFWLIASCLAQAHCWVCKQWVCAVQKDLRELHFCPIVGWC